MSFDKTNKRFSPFEFEYLQRKQQKIFGKMPKEIRSTDEEHFNAYSFPEKTLTDGTATQNSSASSHEAQQYLGLRERFNSESASVVEIFPDKTARDLFEKREFNHSSNIVSEDSNKNVTDFAMIVSQREQQIIRETMPKAQYGISDYLPSNEENFEELDEMNQFQGEYGFLEEQSRDFAVPTFGNNGPYYTRRNFGILDDFMLKGTIGSEVQHLFMNQSEIIQALQSSDIFNNMVSSFQEPHFTNFVMTSVQQCSNKKERNAQITPERNKKMHQNYLQSANTQLDTSGQTYPIVPRTDSTGYRTDELVDSHNLFNSEDIQDTQTRTRATREAVAKPKLQGQFSILRHLPSDKINFEDENFPLQETENIGNFESNFSLEGSRLGSAETRDRENRTSPLRYSQRIETKPKKTRAPKNVITIARGIWRMVDEDNTKFDVNGICQKSKSVKLNDVLQYLKEKLALCKTCHQLKEVICEIEGAENSVTLRTSREEVLRIAARVIVKKFFDEGHFEIWVQYHYKPGSNKAKDNDTESEKMRVKRKKKEFIDEKEHLRDRFLNPSKHTTK